MSSSANSSELINRSTERAEQSYILYNIQMRNELRHRDARGGRRGTWIERRKKRNNRKYFSVEMDIRNYRLDKKTSGEFRTTTPSSGKLL
ncbi:hypothetical protein OUZ56_031814 [Daphnia magna]|uniref:Uncharacterized protein n=1 Tax=Daphnia magna TaxID=35525 RepID=A0ABQ9ZV99_9CRUS|nr:hypothetical protein OUZ56_031814 [Daphnia magna]